jgi:TolB-like protein/tetratricopeptide (TPR) repeat protein
MPPAAPQTYRFGDFTLDLEGHRLARHGRDVPLQPKTFETLCCLVARHGRLVTKRELHESVWGDVAVSDGALARCIVEVRKALGDDSTAPRYIQTVPRLGYRFIADVEPIEPSSTTPTAPAERPVVRSLVVLPFVNLSRDPEQEYFTDGFTDLLIADLGRIAALSVISRTSAMCYRATTKPLPAIARELQVDAAVEGSIMRAGDRVRITVQLIDALRDSHLWAQSYERDLHDLLRLQREVARDVSGAIHVALTSGESKRLGTVRGVDPEAHEAYLKGCYFWHKRTAEDIGRSVEYFQRAAERDAMYALPLAGLAQASGVAGFFGYVPPAQAFVQMKSLATKALTLDPNLPEAHACLAAVHLFYEWDWRAAQHRFLLALEENPSHPVAHEWYGWCLVALGHIEDALAEIRRARQLDPLSVRAHAAVGMGLYFARQHDRALEQLHLALELDPRFADAHCGLGLNYQQLGMWEQSFAAFHEALALSGRGPEDIASAGFAYGAAGRTAEARAMLTELEELATRRYVPAVYFAAVHAGLGRAEDACDWLERAFAERSSWLVFLRVEPWWDSLRSHSRFERLLQQMHLQATGREPVQRRPSPEITD